MKLIRSISGLALAWLLGSSGIGAHAQTLPTLAGRPIHVGKLASVTNPQTANMASEYIAGIELAFNRANALGGVKGRPVVLVTKDDNFDAGKAVLLTGQMVAQNDIVATVGKFGAQPLLKLAAEETLEKHGLAGIAPMTGLLPANSTDCCKPAVGMRLALLR